ncbi:hypothetical protein JXA40_08290 [bacterium]|nr:hypothetical protein [candidate division CSSED10-310 bacterium]
MKPLHGLIFLGVCLTQTACLGPGRTVRECSETIQRGMIHFQVRTTGRMWSGNAAVAVSDQGWIQFEILDVAGRTIGIGRLDEDLFRYADLLNGCRIRVGNMRLRTKSRIGLPLDARTVGRLLLPEPWPGRHVIRSFQRSGRDRLLKVAYLPVGERDAGSIILNHHWRNLQVRLRWDSRRSDVVTGFPHYSFDESLPECGRETSGSHWM